MNASDRKEFFSGVDQVFAAWLKAAPDQRTLDGYWAALHTFDIDEVTEACRMVITQGGHFVPKASDIQAACREVHRQHVAPLHSAPADATCATCEGVGQVVTRTEPYTFAHGDRVITKSYTYVAPCPHCERGRRMAMARSAKRPRQTRQEVA